MSRKSPRPNRAESKMAAALDTRTLLDDISAELLPIMRTASKERWTRDQWRAHPVLSALIQARQFSIAITDDDTSKALAAIKDINDRTEGRATERVETIHILEKLPDEQLDALLETELKELSDDDVEDLLN